jgi:four helix bundle protein
MKLQAPSTKLQGSSKSQAPRKRSSKARPEYSNNGVVAARAFEAANGNGEARHPFDLEERTVTFGEAVVRFVKNIPRSPGNDRLVGQLVGCGTSIGANYCEANERVSKKDFRNTIGRCVKEAKETKYFLRLIAAAEPRLADEARALYREAKELHLIFASMYRQ